MKSQAHLSELFYVIVEFVIIFHYFHSVIEYKIQCAC